jgi:cell division protein FtsL
MKKLIAEEQASRSKMSGRLIIGLVLVVVLLSVIRVFLANWLVEAGGTLRALDGQIAIQTKENQALAEDLRAKESLSAIEAEATALGFGKITKLTFIVGEPHVAFKL